MKSTTGFEGDLPGPLVGELLEQQLERLDGLGPELDWDAELDRIFNEPPDPESLELAKKAGAAMKKYDAWYATLSPAEQEVEKKAQIQRSVNFILHGPGGD